MALKDFWMDEIDFFGHGSFTATQGDNGLLRIKDTSSGGTPTYAFVDGSSSGEVKLTFSNDNEIQILTLYQGDILQYDIDKIREFEARVKVSTATLDSANSLVIGLAGDQNDTLDSVAQNCWFRLAGSNTIVVESDDGTNDNDDKATGKTLSTTYVDLKISFALGTSDVRFFIDGQPVATTTTFDMSNYTGSLQLYVQLQKTADTNTDSVTIDRISVRGIR